MYYAPYDPDPTKDVFWFGKLYHFTWTPKKKNRAPHLILHRGKPEDCRRNHHMKDGAPAKVNV